MDRWIDGLMGSGAGPFPKCLLFVHRAFLRGGGKRKGFNRREQSKTSNFKKTPNTKLQIQSRRPRQGIGQRHRGAWS
jgi:hypothetical protein